MEGMSNLLPTTKSNGWIKGFQVGDDDLEITHLQCADDTLIFYEAVEENILILRTIFIIFEAVFGLHINWSKIFIYPINDVLELDNLTIKLGGIVGKLPAIYLGISLGANNKSIGIWNGVIKKCEKKLTSWKS
ncbi:hypothetical protein P3L10_013870 [Capsicum annuum]